MNKQMQFLFFLLFISYVSSNSLGPLEAPVYQSIYPVAEDPAIWVTVADLSNQGYSEYAEHGFNLDTTSQQTSILKSKCGQSKLPDSARRQTTLTLIMSSKRTPVKVNVLADCLAREDGLSFYDTAALGPGPYALPRQLAISTGLSPTFSYCLPPQNGNGSIFFGAKDYSISSNKGRRGIPLVRIPMEVSSYRVQLTGVEVTKGKMHNLKAPLVFSSYVSLLSLRKDIYRFMSSRILHNLRVRGVKEAFKSKDDPRPPTIFDEHCFRMNDDVMRASPKLKLVFSGNVYWVANPETYFIRRKTNLYCLRIVETRGKEPGVIGTLLQQGRIIEYDLRNKTLGFSKPLAGYNSDCGHTLH